MSNTGFAPRESMSVESQTLSEELGDKGHWLRKFRKAKSLNTLQLMVSNAIDSTAQDPGHRGCHLSGECQRERELEQGRYLDR